MTLQAIQKLHQDQQYLKTKIEEGYTPKQIANELNISYKLVEIYLRKFEIPFISQQIHSQTLH
jgi:DNA-binding CsgD family transcriptional regulator